MATKNFLDLPGLTTYDGYLKQYIAEHAVEGGQADWSQTDTSAPDYIKNKPTLGTAASKNVPTSGNASSTQVVMGSDSRLSDARPASDVSEWAKASKKPTYTASEVGAIANTLKGANNGVAELDANGKVPSSQLPSFVDDVIEGYLYNGKFYKESTHTTEISGESSKIYVDLPTNKTYRWSGSAFVVISDTVALGETSSTAYRGDRGKIAYDHSQSTHARTDATKTEASSTNGNIKINGTETTVYTHPGSGTNPHGTTKSDVGLGNVGNFKAVSTVASQGLTDTEKSNARANIGAGTSSFSGSYNDLSNKPTIPTVPNGFSRVTVGSTNIDADTTTDALTLVAGSNITLTPDATNDKVTIAASQPTVNNGTLTIQKNGTNVQTFTANQSSNATANITVPTKVSQLTNDSGYTTNTGTVTQVKVGSTAYNPSSGIVSLPAYPTSLPASDVSAWAKASTKPTYTASEVGAAASSHTHNYAGSSSAGGNANALAGTYSGSGGALTPSAVSGGQVKAAMMNNPKGLSLFPTYADCILMDTYTGNDVPWTTGLGIIKQDASPRMFIFNGAKGNTTTWKNITEVVTAGNFTSQSLTKSQVTTALGYTPPTSDTNTHRPIQINGTEILGNNTTALNLKAGTNVSLSNSSGTVTISANVDKANYLSVYSSSDGIYSDRKLKCKFGAGQGPWFYLYLDGASDLYTAVNAADYATDAGSSAQSQWLQSFQSNGTTSNGDTYRCRLVKDGTNKRYVFQIINNNTDTNSYEVAVARATNATYATNASSNFTAVGTITGATIKSTGSVYNNSNQRCVDSYADTSFELINHFLKIKTSTNCVISATSGNYSWAIASWSDKRLKDNISNSTVNGMDIINKIKLHSFDFKDEKYGEHQDIGYIAQELKEVVPEAVISVPISEEEKDNYNADELYQVEDKYLIKYLVKAVQELSAEVESLRNKG